MGAWMTEQVATGKTASEAYGRALRDARDEHGHQEGYSGAINSGGQSFVKVDLPKGCTYRKFQGLLEEHEEHIDLDYYADDVRNWRPGGFFNSTGNKRGWKGNLAKAERRLARARLDRDRFVKKVEAAGFWFPTFESYSRTYHDKWEGYLCVELSAHLAKKTYPNAYANKRRGESVYVFFGYAPS